MKPAWSYVILAGISGDGWIAGTAYSASDVRGVVWKPNGADYDIVEIGNLPDTDYSTVTGIDDQHRVIGYNDPSAVGAAAAARDRPRRRSSGRRRARD